MFTHDQVQIDPYPGHVRAVENKEVSEVYDCANTNKNDYRFCTINLVVPMELKEE